MSDEKKNDFLIHIDYGPDVCPHDGGDHDWSGSADITDIDDDGVVIIRGFTRVCVKCGISAFQHSLRYGE